MSRCHFDLILFLVPFELRRRDAQLLIGGGSKGSAATLLNQMKIFDCFKEKSTGATIRRQRKLSLSEFRGAVSWSKHLVSSGSEIEEGREEEWSADMSQLLIGGKFAAGRHSRIYHGRYKGREVAIKLMSQPEEDPALAAALERQFTSEVALLFRLHHPNIITVST
ncbi:hypothetical protein BHE74_00053227 [Ensete ventricosum]|nr:hypothetical protein GW17_00025055 [Ensete ventricosum]RWW41300.1 hypothetical protein BHE74_00053227 [Ensete ventricosum]